MRTLRAGILALALLLTSGCVPEAVGGGGTMRITAYFADSAGLFVGNDVGILGVTVGKVVSIEPDGDQVEVVLEIDDENQVPAEAGAVVVARSVATDRYVELTPAYGGQGPTMEDGAEIPLERTDSPIDFDQVLDALNEFSVGIAGSGETTRAVGNVIDSGSKALEGNGQLFNDTITGLSRAVNSISGQREDAAATVVSLDRLVATIAANEQTARRFIDQVTRASTILAEERGNFRTALRSLESAVTTVADFAATNREDVVQVLDGTTEVMRTILSRRKQLIEVLRVMPLALQNLPRTLSPTNRIRVRASPSVLLPLGSQLLALCQQAAPLPLCDLLPSNPTTPGPTP